MAEITEQLRSLTEEVLAGTDIFIVNIRIRPTNNIKVYLDAESGLPIEKITRVNRALYARIEEAQLYPDGDFSLEVSSPGVDEPLQDLRQYRKNTGRTVLVTLLDGSELLGVLKTVAEDRLLLEVTDKKKKQTHTHEIPFSDIKQTVVQIIF